MIIDWAQGAWNAVAGGLQRVLAWAGMAQGQFAPPPAPITTSKLYLSDGLVTRIALSDGPLVSTSLTDGVVINLTLSEETGI